MNRLPGVAEDLIYKAAAKAVNDTRTNPSAQSRELSVQAARNGFRSAIMEVQAAAEYLDDDYGIESASHFFWQLDKILADYLEKENNEV